MQAQTGKGKSWRRLELGGHFWLLVVLLVACSGHGLIVT